MRTKIKFPLQNLNTRFRKNSSSKGYTLVELLAVTGIIVVISGLIAGILYSTLRGGNKTKVTNDVAQNGNYALTVISNTALNANSVTKVGGIAVVDCSTAKIGSSIEFERDDGSLVAFSCDAITSSIASSSSGLTTTYLIDNNSVKVDPATCSFTCVQSNGNSYSAPIIKIGFTVSQRSQKATFENIASSTFSTSVTMRNYNPR